MPRLLETLMRLQISPIVVFLTSIVSIVSSLANETGGNESMSGESDPTPFFDVYTVIAILFLSLLGALLLVRLFLAFVSCGVEVQHASATADGPEIQVASCRAAPE